MPPSDAPAAPESRPRSRTAHQASIVFVVAACVIFLGSIFLVRRARRLAAPHSPCLQLGGEEESTFHQVRLRLRNQHLERQIDIVAQKASVESALHVRIAALERELAGVKGSPQRPSQASAASSPAAGLDWNRVRAESYRYHTRYWLESKPKWPKDPLPFNNKFVSFTPWQVLLVGAAYVRGGGSSRWQRRAGSTTSECHWNLPRPLRWPRTAPWCVVCSRRRRRSRPIAPWPPAGVCTLTGAAAALQNVPARGVVLPGLL
jgi:hypothetical protein